MIPEVVQSARELADYRNRLHYAWMRYLVGLATGSMAILVSLHTDTQGSTSSEAAHVAMRVAWIALGLGILLGSVVLYGEPATAAALAKQFAARLKEPPRTDASPAVDVFAAPPAICRASEKPCYIALLVALVSLVVHSVLR